MPEVIAEVFYPTEGVAGTLITMRVAPHEIKAEPGTLRVLSGLFTPVSAGGGGPLEASHVEINDPQYYTSFLITAPELVKPGERYNLSILLGPSGEKATVNYEVTSGDRYFKVNNDHPLAIHSIMPSNVKREALLSTTFTIMGESLTDLDQNKRPMMLTTPTIWFRYVSVSSTTAKIRIVSLPSNVRTGMFKIEFWNKWGGSLLSTGGLRVDA